MEADGISRRSDVWIAAGMGRSANGPDDALNATNLWENRRPGPGNKAVPHLYLSVIYLQSFESKKTKELFPIKKTPLIYSYHVKKKIVEND